MNDTSQRVLVLLLSLPDFLRFHVWKLHPGHQHECVISPNDPRPALHLGYTSQSLLENSGKFSWSFSAESVATSWFSFSFQLLHLQVTLRGAESWPGSSRIRASPPSFCQVVAVLSDLYYRRHECILPFPCLRYSRRNIGPHVCLQPSLQPKPQSLSG